MPLTREEMLDYVLKHTAADGKDVFEEDCGTVVFLLEHCTITVPAENRFFVSVNTEGIRERQWNRRMEKYASLLSEHGLAAGEETLAYTGRSDFSHTNAAWENVIGSGIFGLKNRIAAYAEKHRDNAEKHRFYANLLRVYRAALAFLERAAAEARLAGKAFMADGLQNLTEREPQTLFEAMQTSIAYYTLQQFFDGTPLRTLGRLDSLFYPYYVRESKAEADAMLLDYLREIDRLQAAANMPFAIGGTDAAGRSLENALTDALLEAYDRAGTSDTKIHVLCSEKTSPALVEKCLDSVRRGNNSMVFMSDERIIASLCKLGAEKNDAVNYHVVGCYECGAEEELTCSCNARVNIPKALECALNGGKDMMTGKRIGPENSGVFQSFDELYKEFERQLVYFCGRAMMATDLWEAHNAAIHSAPILSGTYRSALETGGDLYGHNTARYNHSSLNAIGLGTAVDALAAIQKAVFEDKILTMEEFCRILRENWKDREPLRLLIKNRYPKYGQDNAAVDGLAKRIVKRLSGAVSGKPNAKGGVYRLGLFSIDWRWEMGEKCAASADGRLMGETLSQNTSATFGADKNGATAHLKSAARIDTTDTPNGAIVDIDLHSSAVSGENGLAVMAASLRTYFELGGFAVHYNVLNTEVLRDAKRHPQKYPNLQVRLCGWNVLFSSLSEKEKDEFIARSVK